MKAQFLKPNFIGIITIASAAILFGCSSLRHALFYSNAYDLGIFDQGTYLISQGKEPIVVFRGIHLLGDHAAYIFYPLAFLYKIVPDVHWLFAVQAIALVSGAWCVWRIALQAGLTPSMSIAIAPIYLLYPLIFNANLFDFHPEVLCIPGIFGAVWAARGKKLLWFCGCVVLTLSTKAVLSLTIAAMGIWLIVFEKRRLYGAIALMAGIAWFIVATQVIIPEFSGGEAAAVNRYSFLGDSVIEIVLNLFLQPGLVLRQIFTLSNFVYLIFFFAPVLWGLSWHHLAPLIAIVPTIALNLIADVAAQKDLVHHYSLPALPFLFLAIISAIAARESWFQRRRWMLAWAMVSFLALAKFGFFWTTYLEELDTWQARRSAIARVETKGNVLTASQIAPHLTHRPYLQLTLDENKEIQLDPFDYILLDLRYPGWQSSPETARAFRDRALAMPQFQLEYQRDDVILFARRL
ncbi:MAG: DUF2079 domain-containing protein [Cyanobacteriota bacterium]|nr:DUF2079 domain-containing protein [Cyanobacteriota bacterium]